MTSRHAMHLHDQRDIACDYARALLADLGAPATGLPQRAPEHPALSWARSGAMALTGHSDEAARVCPIPLAACADGALTALASLAGRALPADLNGARLLGERAAIAGFSRNGSISPGGSCRFLPTADGWIAINLARPDDWEMLPALVERDVAPDWSALAQAVRDRETDALVTQGRNLGLAIAKHGSTVTAGGWRQITQQAAGGAGRHRQTPLVVDLSSLWAGPLCGHLLHLLGARVVKVESARRPDGARSGPAAFYDLLNQGKESVALDLSTGSGREQLRALLARADIVIEASRPRALRQLGVAAEEIVAENPGLTWIGITGYGRTGDKADWVAFGDDAGVSAGLSAFLPTPDGAPIFCGDAIGDPLTGLHAALAAWSGWRSGAGGLVCLALSDVVGHCIVFERPASIEAAADREDEWRSYLDTRGISATAPIARTPAQPARPLGADTVDVLRELGVAC
jgi:hypothetical protein